MVSCIRIVQYTYLICVGLGPSIFSVTTKFLAYSGPSYLSSPVFSAELRAVYLALDRVETAHDDERNFIIFSDSRFGL